MENLKAFGINDYKKTLVFMNIVLKFLLKTYKLTRLPIVDRMWWKLYAFTKNTNKNKSVKIKIHGFKVEQPFDFTYPITSRMVKTYNNPLIECVYQLGDGVVLFDIGAAIGDTVMLIQANCPAMVKNFFCVEGDREFFTYLKNNMADFDNVICVNTLLSDTPGKMKNLVRIHSGTASAQGEEYVESISFDELAESLNVEKIDLIKIDTDGYDGKILRGAEKILCKFKPLVIFEWHPILCKQAETDYHDHFKVLQNSGYKTFIWFTKFGGFSHFVYEPTEKYIEQFAEICIKSEFDNDWHYDIVAFHEQSDFSVLEFANSTYSRNKRSPY